MKSSEDITSIIGKSNCQVKRACIGQGFSYLLPVQSQNVTKNRTDHRMHVESPQICQIKRWNNSFQNVYGMNRQQLTVWPGKSILL